MLMAFMLACGKNKSNVPSNDDKIFYRIRAMLGHDIFSYVYVAWHKKLLLYVYYSKTTQWV